MKATHEFLLPTIKRENELAANVDGGDAWWHN